MGQTKRRADEIAKHKMEPQRMNDMEKDAIARVVREKILLVAWVTAEGLIEWVPSKDREGALFALRGPALRNSFFSHLGDSSGNPIFTLFF